MNLGMATRVGERKLNSKTRSSPPRYSNLSESSSNCIMFSMLIFFSSSPTVRQRKSFGRTLLFLLDIILLFSFFSSIQWFCKEYYNVVWDIILMQIQYSNLVQNAVSYQEQFSDANSIINECYAWRITKCSQSYVLCINLIPPKASCTLKPRIISLICQFLFRLVEIRGSFNR